MFCFCKRRAIKSFIRRVMRSVASHLFKAYRVVSLAISPPWELVPKDSPAAVNKNESQDTEIENDSIEAFRQFLLDNVARYHWERAFRRRLNVFVVARSKRARKSKDPRDSFSRNSTMCDCGFRRKWNVAENKEINLSFRVARSRFAGINRRN